MALVPYSKPYLPVSEQIELLRARGMQISEAAKAETCLRRIGYYRLSGYAYPFRHREILLNPDGSKSERIFENFRPGTGFSTVMDLYVFDKKLRLLILDAIERIEVAIRVEIALTLGKYGPQSYRNHVFFNRYFGTVDPRVADTPHNRLLIKLDQAFERSSEEFAVHYRAKYSSPLPIWMSIELWDFGCMASVLNGMRDPDLDRISDAFGIPKRRYLVSWAQSINFVRNVCAHHGRLWNRPLVQQPALPRAGEIDVLDHLSHDQVARYRLYSVAGCLQYFMRIVHPGSTWGERLKAHVASFPDSPHISTKHMGFPDRWQTFPLWSST